MRTACRWSPVSLLVITAACVNGRPMKSVDVERLDPATWDQDALESAFDRFGAMVGGRNVVRSEAGIVVDTAVAPAALAGAKVLEAGGNAMDAAIAAATSSIVLDLGAHTSFAGISSLVYFDASTGEVHTLDACWNGVEGEPDPDAIPRDEPSGRTVLVPGFMAGVEAAHERFGALPFAATLAPAIAFAEDGFALPPFFERILEGRRAVLERREETRRIFTGPDGELYRAGDLFRQPALAETLRAVAEQGAAYMYSGPWAEALVEAVREEGGRMTMADLAAYEPTWSPPVRATYGGREFCFPGGLSFSSANLYEAFSILERVRASVPKEDRAQHLRWLMRALHVQHVMNFTPDELVARHLPDISTALDARVTPEHVDRLWDAMNSGAWDALLDDEDRASRGDASSGSHTDSVVAVDAAGNVAAMTFTINAQSFGGTGIFVGGVSVPDAALWNLVYMRGAAPGDRLPNGLNPLIVLEDGEPVLAWSAIGSGIHETTVQTLVAMLDRGVDASEAAEAPQVHLYNTPFLAAAFGERPDGPLHARIVAEGEFDRAVLDEVRALGQPVIELPDAKVSRIRGMGVALTIDRRTGVRQGTANPVMGGAAVAEDPAQGL